MSAQLPIVLEPSLELVAAFAEAKKNFLDSLTVEEQARLTDCSSAQSLLHEVKKFEVIAKSKQRGLRFAQKIQSLSDSLGPYFSIIEIFCGAHPEYANLAWGALRLILQLASNFATFFEKLCETIRRLSLALPQFEDALKTLSSGPRKPLPKHVHSLMVLFYTDLFTFFQAVARVFSDKKGRIKRTPVVIGDLLWKPFDVRFKEILEQMEYHKKTLMKEINSSALLKIQSLLQDQIHDDERTKQYMLNTNLKVSSLAVKYDQEKRDLFCASVLRWLAPPQFASPFEQAQDAREIGTAEWLFRESKFEVWREATSGSVLWLEGNPGWGKTVLAASTVEELRSSQNPSSQTAPIVCYYFFYQDKDRKASRIGAYRALATQIFQQCNHFNEIFDIYALANDGVRTLASEHELLDLLRITIPRLSDVYFVFDSIDECSDNEKFLRELVNITTLSNLKTILFSRPNVAYLRRSIRDEHNIRMSREILDKDIAVFLDSELQTLQDSALLPLDFELDVGRDILLQRADGMFLWARLMMCYLNSVGLTRQNRIDEISNSTPERLEDMYRKIFDHIKSMDSASRQLASRVFMWVGYGKSPLTSEQIKEVAWGLQPKVVAPDQLDDIDHAIIVSCCGLIEKRVDSNLRFIHLTARDFILSPSLRLDNGASFLLLDNEAASEMAQKCIKYLLSSIPARPLSGDILESSSPAELRHRHPFLQYATRHWTEHATDALPNSMSPSKPSLSYDKLEKLGDALEGILTSNLNLMVWIEAVYTYRDPLLLLGVSDLAEMLEISLNLQHRSIPASVQRSSKEMRDLAVDLKKLRDDWEATLLTRPHEIWNDVTVFTPSRFFVSSSAATITYFTSKDSEKTDFSEEPLFSTSSNSSDAQLIAKLGIWPSRAFAEFWELPAWEDLSNPLGVSHLDQLNAMCIGWKARYDVFEIGGRLQSSTSVLLQTNEISLLLKQSLRKSRKTWSLTFPMSISRDLSTIIVLRTILHFDLGSMKTPMPYFSAVVPFETSNWSPTQQFFTLTFSYRWLISFDSSYIVYNSFDRSYNPNPQSLRIFKISTQPDLVVRHINTIHPVGVDSADFVLCALHPQRPLLIFATATAIYRASLEGEDEIVKLIDIELRLETTVIANNIRTSPSFLEEIGFSACGSFFTAKYPNAWPSIHPLQLPDNLGDNAVETSIAEVAISNVFHDRKRRLSLCTDEPYDYSTQKLTKIPKVIQTESVVVSNHNNSADNQQSITLSHMPAPQSIDLIMQRENSSLKAVSLARFPKHIDISRTKSTVLLPSSQRNSLQVIITEPPKPSYYSDEINASPYLPAVLNRDPRSIAPPRHVGWIARSPNTGGSSALHHSPQKVLEWHQPEITAPLPDFQSLISNYDESADFDESADDVLLNHPTMGPSISSIPPRL